MAEKKPTIRLERPHIRYQASYMAAMDEFESSSEKSGWVYLGDREPHDTPVKDFGAFVARLLATEFEALPGFVKNTCYWAIAGEEVVGRIALRHETNDFLRKIGGQVGYLVRPSFRNRGVATEMLRQLLQMEQTREKGSVLITCDENNTASERTIRKNGGVFESLIENGSKPRKKRFWIDLYPDHPAHATEDSIRYLNSESAKADLNADVYWPKWTAPWWQMLLLHEMRLTDRIPPEVVQHFVSRLRAQLVPYFFAAEVPEGRHPQMDATCPCQLGNVVRFLSAAGVDVDQALPWARPWFLRYQMPDGGLSCDEEAYRSSPPASSIVATIAPLEAVLFSNRGPFTPAEEQFLDRGADCLIRRKLMLGCSVEHNAEERLDESDWLKLCFPRFYFYDVLRGLSFVLQWSEKRRMALPLGAIQDVVNALEKKFPDGRVRIERLAYEGVGTRFQSPDGKWTKKSEADFHPLLREVSKIGEVSPYLSLQWKEAKAKIAQLEREGWIK